MIKNDQIMRYAGYSSQEHLYNDCKNPKKVNCGEKLLKEIRKMNVRKQKSYLRSWYIQLDDQNDK